MHVPLFTKRTDLVYAVGIGVALLFCGAAPAVADGAPDRHERLKILQGSIDSLELEKQAKKRSGQSLDELEEKTARLRDSITALRLEVQQLHLTTRPASGQSIVNGFLPESFRFVDRYTVAGAALALFVAIVWLLIAVRVRGRRARSQAKPEWSRETGSTKTRTPVTKAYATQMTMSEKPAAVREAAPQRPAPPVDGSLQNINNLVIQADREGLNPREISQKYRLGIDQVSLILRMNKKN